MPNAQLDDDKENLYQHSEYVYIGGSNLIVIANLTAGMSCLIRDKSHA